MSELSTLSLPRISLGKPSGLKLNFNCIWRKRMRETWQGSFINYSYPKQKQLLRESYSVFDFRDIYHDIADNDRRWIHELRFE